MKIYTGKGDSGKTTLFSGEQVSKSHTRIEAYGDVDELNSVIGALSASLPDEYCVQTETLSSIQSDLLHLGSWLAMSPDSVRRGELEPFGTERIRFLEEAIDRLQRLLPDLKEFILPGGHTSSAWAHIARSVCRRVERRVVALREGEASEGTDEPSLQNAQVYLNRLSDYFFVLARWCNFKHGMSDMVWGK
ncbi:MAG: cob(I)yrinic acid a,c-diamide adenosyltransferase [Candidatus Aminicenantaceae bacterium]